MTVRYCEIGLVFLVGVFTALVGYNNILDYNSNFEYVQHVLSMDTTFPGRALLQRAITNASLHHACYWLIIVTEFIIAFLCLAGSLQLVRALRKSPAEFNHAKALAIAGLCLGFTLWFFGFLTVGAEWFQMWQSQSWNGQQAAFRTLACFGIVLLFVNQSKNIE